MSLKNKVAAILVLIMVISTLTFYGVFKLIVFKSFVDAENNDAEHDMHQCISSLRLEIKHLDRFVHDWSSWDDVYKFATDGNREFIKENLDWTEFRDQSLNLIHFYDRNGKLIWGKTFDLKTEKEIPLDLVKELNAALFHRLIIEQKPERFSSGIIQTSIGPMMIAARPILTSENKGPIHGTLIMGRLFTEESLTALSEQVGVDLKAWPVGDERMPKAIRELMPLLKDRDSVRLTYASSNILHAYSIVKDLNNQPAILLEASFPRNITHKGMRAYVVGMMFILGVGILVFVSISGMLRAYVLKPIAKLTEDALAIGVSAKDVKGFEISREDEIGVLSREFGAMVHRLSMSEERYRLMAELTGKLVYDYDVQSGCVTWHGAISQLTGYTEEEFQRIDINKWEDMIHPEDRVEALSLLETAMRECGIYHTEYRFRLKDGSYIFIEDQGVFLPDTMGKAKRMLGNMGDITSRKNAEKTIRKSEERYRTVFESTATANIIVAEDTMILFANSNFEEMTGYSRRELEGKMSWTSFVVEEDLERVKTYHMMRRLKPGSVPNSYELRFINRQGQVRDLFMSVAVIPETKVSVASIIDITERKQAEEALKKSEERYRTIFEHTGNASVLLGDDTTILLANSNYEKLSGYSRQELEGKMSWTTFVDKEDLEKMRQYHEMRRIEQGSAPESYEFRFINRNGEKRDIFLSIAIIPGTKVSVASLMDITERKQVEESLQQSEAKYRFLTEKMNDLIWTANLDFNLTYISPSVVKLLGFTPEERIRQNPAEMMTSKSYAIALDVLSKELKNEQEEGFDPDRSVKMELDFYRKNGSIVRMESVMSAIRDHDGKIVGIHGVSRDITERKRAEEEKERLEAQLAQAQKLESIGTLAGGIAHDFNNILSAIIGYTELAMDDVSDTKKTRSELKEVLKAGDRAKDLVRQILAFSRQTETKHSPLALHTIIKETIKMMRSVIPTTIEIRQNLIDSGIVMSDPTQIHQIMMNLFTNAVHAMDKTGGVLDVSLKRVSINGDAETHDLDLSPGSYLRISVSDNGQGMTPEVMARVFDPYFTTKEVGRGTGLGLSVVHGIVKSHGGVITCKSTHGEGTIFDVYLPELDSGKETLNTHEKKPLPTGTERILFVDDEPVLIDLTKKMLENLGYTVVTRTSSIEALELFRNNPDKFDLVITDMTMPAMTGDKLTQRILEIRKDILVILCTGYSELISEEKAKKIGVKEFIMKPLVVRDLAIAIRKVLDVG